MICGRRAVRLKSACTAAPAGPVDGRAATAFSCGAESPSPVFVVARRRSLFFLSRESHAVVLRIYVLALRLCKKRSLCIRANKHGGYYYYYVIAPGSGSGLAAATARPSK